MSSSRSALLHTLYGGRIHGADAQYAPVASTDMGDLVPMAEEDAVYGPSSRQQASTSKLRSPRRYFRDQIVTPLLGRRGSSDFEEEMQTSSRSSSDHNQDTSSSDSHMEKLLPLSVKRLLSNRRRRRRRCVYGAAVLVLLLCGVLAWRQYGHFTIAPMSMSSIPSSITESTSIDPGLKAALHGDFKESGPPLQQSEAALKSECCNPTYDILPNTVTPVKSLQSMTEEHLEGWIASGKLPSRGVDLSRHSRIDGVTMWVNGSDPRHRSVRKFFSTHLTDADVPAKKQKLQPRRSPRPGDSRRLSGFGSFNPFSNLQNTDNHFREFNELLYNVRTARAHLKDQFGTHHIISTDFWESSDNYTSTVERPGSPNRLDSRIRDRKFSERRGQLPQWLDTDSRYVALGSDRANEPVAVRMHHDWETFVPLVPPSGEDKTKAIAQWRAERLPTFSSTAAEAVLGINLPGLSEAFFLSSDDMFITNQASTSDFYSPLFGPVMHMEFERQFHGSDHPHPGNEHAGHEFSVALLFKRFGAKSQAYPSHMVKGQLQPHVLEARILFRKAFEKASASRFRGDGISANSHMLGYGTVVERHREALLWSFFMAKIDANGDGILDEEEYQNLLTALGAGKNTTAIIEVDASKNNRHSTFESHITDSLDRARFPKPLQSTYRFSSFDGYPYAYPYTGRFYTRAGVEEKRALFSRGTCRIKLAQCLPRNAAPGMSLQTDQPLDTNVENIFKRFAFEKHQCGSCLVQHLIGQSGKKGLAPFLPPRGVSFSEAGGPAQNKPVSASRSKLARTDYHLPLTDDWNSTDFSLSTVAKDNGITADAPVSLRAFAVSLLARYNYVVADAPSEFQMLKTPRNAEYHLDRLVDKYVNLRTRFAFLCINDDVSDNVEGVRQVLLAFFVRLWPSKQYRLPFEIQPPIARSVQ